VNFGPLAAEIGSVVWGTQANFNGFRVLASLLHGIRAVAPAKLCRVEQRAPAIFGRAAITFGIGPHSSHSCFRLLLSIVSEGVAPDSYLGSATGPFPEMTYNVFSGTLNPTHFTPLDLAGDFQTPLLYQ